MYTWAKSTLKNECAVGVYAIDKCVRPDAVDTVYIANGCSGDRVLVEMNGVYDVLITDCRGHEISHTMQYLEGINVFEIPSGGIAILRK